MFRGVALSFVALLTAGCGVVSGNGDSSTSLAAADGRGTVGTPTTPSGTPTPTTPSPAAPLHLNGGALPTGRALNAGDGQISGTPTEAGTFNLAVTVAASSSPQSVTTTASASLAVGPASTPAAPGPPPIGGNSALSAVWANDGGDKVTQDELRASSGSDVRNNIWDGNTIHLFGAQNEVIEFNLVLEAAKSAASGVSVSISNLSGPSGATLRCAQRRAGGMFDWSTTEIELFYVRYLQIKGISYFGFGPLEGFADAALPGHAAVRSQATANCHGLQMDRPADCQSLYA